MENQLAHLIIVYGSESYVGRTHTSKSILTVRFSLLALYV